MNKTKNTSVSIGGAIVLIIFIAMVLIITLTFLDSGPFPALKSNMRKWAQDAGDMIQQPFSGNQSTVATGTLPAIETSATPVIEKQTVSNWEYTLKQYQWSRDTVSIHLNIRNLGGTTLPFGFSYVISDEKFTTIYRLCLQDSSKQVFWDLSMNGNGEGFYNQYFTAGEIKAGTLQFKVSPNSEKVYLCLANGDNVATKLFYLGAPIQQR